MSELAKQMKDHGITDPWNLTEFDQWVNDATRKDIETTVKENNFEVFGLHIWKPWTKIRGKDLTTVPPTYNFSVDIIFKNSDEPKVDEIIKNYEDAAAGKEWNKELQKLTWKTVNALHKLAIESCLWV